MAETAATAMETDTATETTTGFPSQTVTVTVTAPTEMPVASDFPPDFGADEEEQVETPEEVITFSAEDCGGRPEGKSTSRASYISSTLKLFGGGYFQSYKLCISSHESTRVSNSA